MAGVRLAGNVGWGVGVRLVFFDQRRERWEATSFSLVEEFEKLREFEGSLFVGLGASPTN